MSAHTPSDSPKHDLDYDVGLRWFLIAVPTHAIVDVAYLKQITVFTEYSDNTLHRFWLQMINRCILNPFGELTLHGRRRQTELLAVAHPPTPTTVPPSLSSAPEHLQGFSHDPDRINQVLMTIARVNTRHQNALSAKVPMDQLIEGLITDCRWPDSRTRFTIAQFGRCLGAIASHHPTHISRTRQDTEGVTYFKLKPAAIKYLLDRGLIDDGRRQGMLVDNEHVCINQTRIAQLEEEVVQLREKNAALLCLLAEEQRAHQAAQSQINDLRPARR